MGMLGWVTSPFLQAWLLLSSGYHCQHADLGCCDDTADVLTHLL